MYRSTGNPIRNARLCALIDVALTVKAATLIFISGRGSAISGNSGFSGSSSRCHGVVCGL